MSWLLCKSRTSLCNESFYFLEFWESGCGSAWQCCVCPDTPRGELLAPGNSFTCAATCALELGLLCQVTNILHDFICASFFSHSHHSCLYPALVTINKESWNYLKEAKERSRGDHKILEDVELVGSSVVLCWVRKWVLMLASSNDRLFFLSWPQGTELLPAQGEHRDKRRFTGRHLSQKKKNQKSGREWALFQKIWERLLEVYNAFMYPRLVKIPSLLIFFPNQESSQKWETTVLIRNNFLSSDFLNVPDCFSAW